MNSRLACLSLAVGFEADDATALAERMMAFLNEESPSLPLTPGESRSISDRKIRLRCLELAMTDVASVDELFAVAKRYAKFACQQTDGKNDSDVGRSPARPMPLVTREEVASFPAPVRSPWRSRWQAFLAHVGVDRQPTSFGERDA